MAGGKIFRSPSAAGKFFGLYLGIWPPDDFFCLPVYASNELTSNFQPNRAFTGITKSLIDLTFLNIGPTWTCSSIGNRTQTPYFWLQTIKNWTLKIVRPITTNNARKSNFERPPLLSSYISSFIIPWDDVDDDIGIANIFTTILPLAALLTFSVKLLAKH